eukprot:CAMPEP_0119281862 /NCGR_PEP_ID=MMETSP1329-20130426/25655_1 /TAXON_ID=114041 /ORGANISM="Genus nov. species nov., Strain RCC1024" /LENGTH=93 /DNA_ID=CAMNT_0007282501 /DNA_START=48 /DNA_END=326 /DNA_ORIENTATION=+
MAAAPKKRCLVIAGSPASGKTTLAALVARRLGAALVDKDTLEWPLANAALEAKGLPRDAHDAPYYGATLKPLAYETCFRVAEQQRCDTVIVAP